MLAEVEEWKRIAEESEKDEQYAEHYLLHYEQERRAYEEAKAEAARKENDGNTGGGKGNLPGKPTESAAIREVEFDAQYEPYLWLKAVEYAQAGLGERKNIFIKVRREAERSCRGKGPGRPSWVVFTQLHYIEAVQQRFLQDMAYISEKTVRLWWHDIVRRVMEIRLRLSKK